MESTTGGMDKFVAHRRVEKDINGAFSVCGTSLDLASHSCTVAFLSHDSSDEPLVETNGVRTFAQPYLHHVGSVLFSVWPPSFTHLYYPTTYEVIQLSKGLWQRRNGIIGFVCLELQRWEQEKLKRHELFSVLYNARCVVEVRFSQWVLSMI